LCDPCFLLQPLNQICYTTWVCRIASQNYFWNQNWRGCGTGSISNNWDPNLFVQQLKLANSYLVHNLGSRRKTCRSTLCRELGLGSTPKIFGPLLIFATTESNHFKFGTTWVWRVASQNNFWDKNWESLGYGSTNRNKCGTLATYFCNH